MSVINTWIPFEDFEGQLFVLLDEIGDSLPKVLRDVFGLVFVYSSPNQLTGLLSLSSKIARMVVLGEVL